MYFFDCPKCNKENEIEGEDLPSIAATQNYMNANIAAYICKLGGRQA